MQEQGVRRDCAFECRRRLEKHARRPVDTRQDKVRQARLHSQAMPKGDGSNSAPDEKVWDVQEASGRAIDKRLVCRYDRIDRIVNTIKSKYERGTCDFN